MLGKNNSYRVLKVFLNSPIENFRLREIARISKISPPSVMNYLAEFEKKGLIKKIIKNKIPFYSAFRDNPDFILYKKMSILFELNESGLINYLWEKLSPEAIVLYGSFSRGESIENSDIDLFILGKERFIKLEEFEKKLNKNVHILFKKSLKELPSELKNNVLNGIILKGYLKIF
ncbi:MAG: nucleotidyltransferase domain-containing protein [Nanoarchaeota archaeon]